MSEVKTQPEVIEIKSIEDVQKAFDVMKKNLEEKGAENVKNFEEKIKALEDANEELKKVKPEITPEELKSLKEDVAITLKAFDQLQVRLKDTRVEQKGNVLSFDDEIKAAVEANFDNFQKLQRKDIKDFNIEIKAVGDISTANITGGNVWGAQYRAGIIENPDRLVHMRNIISSQNAGPGTDLYFMKENGAGEGDIKPTAEKKQATATNQATGLKPQFDYDFLEDSVKFETIAGHAILSRKAMFNVPSLVSFLQKRVPERYLNAEDAQILYGDGSTPNIKGILTTGNFAVSTAEIATPLIEKIIDDLTMLEDQYERMATNIILRPAQFHSFFKNKASGSGEYDLPQGVTFVNGVLYILGIPVTKTTALNDTDYAVCDLSGVEIHQQEAMNIKFSESHGDTFIKNQITMRVEGTMALPVYGSNYIIKGTSATS